MTLRRTAALMLALAAIAAGSHAHAAAPQDRRGWETVKTETAPGTTVAKETEVEIKAVRGAIIVNVIAPKGIDIQVYSIIGRRVNAESLPQGTHRLTLPAHGVYIVKVGELTCKVAV